MKRFTIPYTQINAFTSADFGGNPAGVCLLEQWISDELMQKIAAENDLSETAFLVGRSAGEYHLRWFTPTTEVDLCGHATLASAHALFRRDENAFLDRLVFHTRSGELIVTRSADGYSMNFPKEDFGPLSAEAQSQLQSLYPKAVEAYQGTDLMVIFPNEDSVQNYDPDLEKIANLPCRGLIITAKAKDSETDFVSRFFAPAYGIPEDAVTGSAHCMLAPYWSEVLKKNTLKARQLSERIGFLECEVLPQRVVLKGVARTFIQGQISISV